MLQHGESGVLVRRTSLLLGLPITACSLLVVLAIPIDVSPSAAMACAAAEEHLCTTPAEEHVEDVVRVKLLLVESILLLISLLEILLCSMLVVEAALVRLAQTGVRGVDLLEGIVRLGCVVLIRMEPQGKLPVCLFQLSLICSLGDT